MKIFNIFENFSSINGLDFQFAFIFVEHHYESNYSKLQNSDIYIEFAPKRVIPLKDALAVTALPPNDDEKNGYYYIYSSKKNFELMKIKEHDLGFEVMKYISRNWGSC